MTPSRRVALALIAAALTRCEEAPAPPLRFACARANEAPLPDGFGEHRCLRVGAREGLRAELWPVTDGLPTPVVFVRAGAPAGGDGTRDRPLDDLDLALARGAPTVALARGQYRLATRTRLSAPLTLVGADVAGTTVTLPAGTALTVRASLALRTLTLRGTDAGEDVDVAVRALPGAALTVDDVAIEGDATALAAEGADVTARHLTVRRARRGGVELTGATRAVMRSVLIRGCGGSGLALDRARLALDEALVAANGRKGLVLLGEADVARGFGDCRAADVGAAAGPRDCLGDVASVDNHINALQVSGRREVEARRLFLAGTTRGDDTPAADGALVAEQGDLTLDPEIAAEVMQGFGSELADNARFGLLVDGNGGGAAPSRVSVRGAVLRGNAFGGAFLQRRAVATRVEFSRFERNGGVGLAATAEATVTQIGCNGFLATRPATLSVRTPDGAATTFEVADGLSVAGSPGLTVTANRFADNARFAATFVGAGGRVEGNSGAGNRYGLGVYDSPALVLAASNRVVGREAPPATLPAVLVAQP